MDRDLLHSLARRSDMLSYRALDVRRGIRSEAIWKVVARNPHSIEQTLVADLNQVQDVNALILVSLGDGHNNVQIRLNQIFRRRFRFLTSAPYELNATPLFTWRERWNLAYFVQVNLHRVVNELIVVQRRLLSGRPIVGYYTFPNKNSGRQPSQTARERRRLFRHSASVLPCRCAVRR